MRRIHVLPETLVNQIAAGEVVERPASVVKELVENALDAGATRITVDIENGGVARIEVTDDGSGMGPEDARLALERHATSKIATTDDLVRIGTLGFRGEALPSIASVSRLALTTSADGTGLGTEVVGDNGAAPTIRPARQTTGTRVVVENLFANVPARRKFLKSTDAEVRAVVRSVTALALARPDVAFTLRSGPRLLLDLPVVPDASARFREILGSAFTGSLVPVSFSHRGMNLAGAVTPPETTFPSKTYQWLFVNGRAVKDATASHAAQLAAREAIRSDRHPGFALFITCLPDACDVNVHPQKLEVRFRDPSAVHTLVHRGLLAALGGAKGATEVEAEAFAAAPAWILRRAEPFARPSASMAETIEAWGAALTPAAAADVARSSYAVTETSDSPLGPLRLLGQYRDSFLVAEGSTGLVLIDQHVAHERVRFERILDQLEKSAPASQAFLLPITFEASAQEAALLLRAGPLLSEAGFVVSERSGGNAVVSAAPAGTPASAVIPFLRDFLARLAEIPEGGDGAARGREALAASLACRGAVTVNTRLAPAEAAKLLGDLARCRDPWTCPHGRPILLTFSHAELEKRFGRRT
ncbi:MAG: DNA mismatch repair endonuclease MutL [Thermoanaerobaculia bacterium]